MIKVAVFGSGSLAFSAIKIFEAERPECVTHFFLDKSTFSINRDLLDYCHDKNIEVIEVFSGKSFEWDKFTELKFDLVFSLNNFIIFPRCVVKSYENKIINFHNAPLPDYKGMHPCFWAIYNQEVKHGVSFHVVEPEIDTGNVIARKLFEISAEETSFLLIVKCMQCGVALMREHAKSWLVGDVSCLDKLKCHERMYTSKDIPETEIMLHMKNETISSRTRALNYELMPSPFSPAYLRNNGKKLYFQKARRIKGEDACSEVGTVLQMSPLSIRMAEDVWEFSNFVNKDGMKVPQEKVLSEFSLQKGNRID